MAASVAEQSGEVFRQAQEALTGRGIIVEGLRLQEGIVCPEMVVYRRGLEYQEQLLRLTEQQELERRRFEQQLQLTRLESAEYRSRLSALQELLKQSPEILKYIYIDKLAGHKELLPPVAPSGYPLDIEAKEREQQAVPSGDIDNFRR